MTPLPYPPLSQLIGAAEYLLWQDSFLGPKIAVGLFDILNYLALLWLLDLFGLDRRKVILLRLVSASGYRVRPERPQ